MAKIKSVVSASDLKSAVSKLPQGEEDEGVRFRAISGEKKGEKTPSGGLFVGPQMLAAFEKEKKKFSSMQLFEGLIKRSQNDPNRRLVLITRSDARSLRVLAGECLKQSKLTYQIVTLKPGEKEPEELPDDDGVETDTVIAGDLRDLRQLWTSKLAEKRDEIRQALRHPTLGDGVRYVYERISHELKVGESVGQLKLELGQLWGDLEEKLTEAAKSSFAVEDQARQKQQSRRVQEGGRAAVELLTESFPAGRAALLEKETRRLVGGSGKEFRPVLIAMKMVESEPNPGNVADLEAAVRAYLQHVARDYSDKDRNEKINKVKIAVAQKALQDIERAKELQQPGSYDSRHRATWTTALDWITPEAGKLCRFPEPLGVYLDELNEAWDRATDQDPVPEDLKNQIAEQASKVQELFKKFMAQIETLHQEHPDLGKDWYALHNALSKIDDGLREDMQDVGVRYRSVVTSPGKQQYGIQSPPPREVQELDDDQERFAKVAKKIGEAKDYPTAARMILLAAESCFAPRPQIGDKIREDVAHICTKRNNSGASVQECLQTSPPDLKRAKELALGVQRDSAQLPVSFPRFGGLIKKAIEDHILKPMLQEITAAEELEAKARARDEERRREIVQGISEDLQDYGGISKEVKKETVTKVMQEAMKFKDQGRFEEYQEELERAPLRVRGLLDRRIWEGKIGPRESLQGRRLKLLGKGANGAAFEIEGTDVPLVGKINFSMEESDENMARLNRQNEEHLRSEARLYSEIGDHPNIVRCLGLQELNIPEGHPEYPPGERECLVLEKLSGTVRDANKVLKDRYRQGKIKHEEYWGTVQHTLIGMLQGLDHLAGKGFVHCDIKDDNVMYDDQTGDIKLVDMGEVTKEKSKPEGGASSFQAPEILKARSGDEGPSQVSGKGDVFMLGAMLYQFGEEGDFDDKARQNQMKPIEEDGENGPGQSGPGRYQGGYTSEYVKFVNWALNPDPNKRPTARQALQHPFLQDRILPEDKARKVLQELNREQQSPTVEPVGELSPEALRSASEPFIERVATLAREVQKALDENKPGNFLGGLRDVLRRPETELKKIQRSLNASPDFPDKADLAERVGTALQIIVQSMENLRQGIVRNKG
jgi:serine/threonine protein kinase